MSYNKIGYYRIVVSLVGVVLLVILCAIVWTSQKETEELPIDTNEGVATHVYNITEAEREMLARLVYLEANTESLECQKAIASVVINRLQNGAWGDTLEGVIYYPYQFTPASLIDKTTPTQTNYDAVDYVLENGSILPKYCMYFRANYGFSNTDWANYGYHEYKQLDNTFFGYFEKDK